MTVINKIRSLFDDRRKEDQPIFSERRQCTLTGANKRLREAAQELEDTITISGEKIQEMIRKAKL